MGNCYYCNKNAGFLRKEHRQCGNQHEEGVREMTQLVAQAAGTLDFRESALRQSLQSIADCCFASEQDINSALVNGWTEGVWHAMADGLLTKEEEKRLRNFRDQLALANNPDARTGSSELQRGASNRGAQEVQAASERLSRQARQAALSKEQRNSHLHELQNALSQTNLSEGQRRRILIRGWEAAVEAVLEDNVITMDEENALVRYLDHFDLTGGDVNANGAHTSLVQAGIIRDVAQGIVPQRLNLQGSVPFNLMKSEQLVWVIDDVDYLETVTRRERRGTSHGVGVRVAGGLYYQPRTFRSRSVEWEETDRADTGMLGLTTKHIYFAGSRKRFRIRYDRIVAFEPFSDGLGVMRDAQSAKPQSFVTGDGWFVYNLATNLAQM